MADLLRRRPCRHDQPRDPNQPCTVICASMKLPSVNTFSIVRAPLHPVHGVRDIGDRDDVTVAGR
jgi:hypothetical protein